MLNILVLASLSFLGLGVQPPTAEWGLMVAEGQTFLLTAWWISTLPGLVIVIAGVGFSLVGDGLADRLGTGRRGRAGENEGMILTVAEEPRDGAALERGSPAAPAARGAQPPHRVRRRRSGSIFAAVRRQLLARRGRDEGARRRVGLGQERDAPLAARARPGAGRVVDGEVLWGGRDLLRLPPAELRAIRGREIAMIFQDPTSCLNPVYTIGEQIAETLRVKLGMSGRAARDARDGAARPRRHPRGEVAPRLVPARAARAACASA